MRPSRLRSGVIGLRLRWPRLPLRAYFLVLVSLLVVTAVATATFVAVQSDRDARDRAVKDAAFSAAASAKQLGAFVAALKATTKQLAGSPQIEQVLVRPEACSLTFSGIGGPDSSRIDIVRADGVVLCSSREQPAGTATRYTRTAWLSRATAGRMFVRVATDELTGAHVMISAVPIAGGKAVIAALGDLDAVGPELAAAYGGGRPSEFLVTSADRETVLARSTKPKRWVGKPLAGTAFAQGAENVERRDLNGVARFYKSVPVPALGWRVYVGEEKGAALAAQERLKRRQLVIVLAGLLASLIAAWLVYRSVLVPINRLSRALRSAPGKPGSVPVTTAGPTEVTALGEDINDLITSVNRELAERLESEARYRDLFENASDLIAVLDPHGRIVSVNAAFSRALGRAQSELIGSTMPELLPPEPNTEPVHVAAVYERELNAEDGRLLHIEIASRMIEEEGRVVGWEAIGRDITERKHLEEQLRQAQRLESVGRLAGGVAHDFNNLLTVIGGYADMLLAAHGSEGKNELREIQAAAARAASLTGQLLAFSRQQVLQARVLDLNEVVRGVLPMLSRLIGEDIEIIQKLAPAVHPVIADQTQLEQVIVNLVVNARDAMPHGGTLAIETSNVRLDETYLAQHPEARLGANAMLAVTDTGIGMDADTLARAFEPFFSTKPIGAGTGLGLATVHGIVKQSGGSIWPYSEPGIGTTIKVYLPMTIEARSEVTDANPAHTPAVGTETVLIAEDEDILRPLLAQMLEARGYTTITAGSAAEAIAIVDRGDAQIDLLLTDLIMPEMNGRELAERIHQRQESIPVLFMSGYAGDTVTRNKTLDADAAFLEKPFSSDDLAQKVRETLNDRRPR